MDSAKIAYGDIREEKKLIDLYVWIDRHGTPRRDEMSEAVLEPEPPVRDVVPDRVVDHPF
jgi:hypothetical protein